MNVPTHLAGQMAGQLPNQVGQQVSGPSQLVVNSMSSQMQSIGNHAHKMDPEVLMKRERIQEYIMQLLQRRTINPTNPDVLQKIPEIARRLEDRIYKDILLKGEDYINMPLASVYQRLQGITKNFNSSQQGHFMQSSSVSTMIPTPGLTSYGSNGLSVSQDNTAISAGGSNMIAQTGVNMGNILSNTNRPVSMGQISSFNATTGAIQNGYPPQSGNMIHNSGGNGIVSSMGMMRQSSMMIPTPGLNNPQSISITSEPSGGGGFSNVDSPMVSQQQQKQYDGSQNNRLMNGVGTGIGVRSNLQQKVPPYSLPNAVTNGGMGGLVATNVHHMNRPTASDGYLGAVSYGGSPKSLPQHFDKQQHQSLMTASVSQHMLPLAGDLSGSGNINGCGSAALSTANSQNPNLNSRLRSNHGMIGQPSLTAMQHAPPLRPQMPDNSHSTNFQTTHSAREQLLQSQHPIQSFQHQPVPNQRYQYNAQHQQQLIANASNVRHFSMPSNFSGQMIPKDASEATSESLLPHVDEQFQNEYQNNLPSGNLLKGAQLVSQIQGPHNVQALTKQVSQKVWEVDQRNTESQNELSCLFVKSQSEVISKENWYQSNAKEKLSFEQNIQKEFHQRMEGKNEAQPLETSPDARAFVAHSATPELSNKTLRVSNMEQDYYKQRKWLLLLLHSRKCPSLKGQCKEVNCIKVQQLWMHIDSCNSNGCLFPRCSQSKKLFNHFINCKVAECPVCVPVQQFIASIKARNNTHKMNGTWKNATSPSIDKVMSKAGFSPCDTSDSQPPSKRLKVQNAPSFVPKIEETFISTPANQISMPNEAALTCKMEVFEAKMDTSVDGWCPIPDMKLDVTSNSVIPAKGVVEPSSTKESEAFNKMEIQVVDKDTSQAKMETNQEVSIAPTDPAAASKPGKPKIKGVSMTELFSIEQVRDHIISLRQWIGQSKAKAEKNQAMERSMSENSCQLCAVEKLTFEPPPIYCTLCGTRIKRNAMYYTIGNSDTRHYFCIPCYNDARCDTIEAEGSAFPKSRMEKKKNDEETEEWWVQCDKCEAWQHQICALFNGRRNEGGQAEYTCPNCYMEEIEKGERKPLPQNTVLGAKDLPRSILSDHIEQRLFKRLKHERQERARQLGRSYDEVPGAESLVVRVVSSVDKKLEVKQRFLEIFQEENYPTEFPYKSKVVLLFQKIEGVEVCLFGMYVQEFGSECSYPNQRRVYLSYLDSVKYFRPEIKTVTGEALRTFVYHEILIGYLEYCKKRGFTSCYIWACPPLKGEDYILYCHPEIQKTPKSDKLREWYLSMLRKANKEAVVVGLTNLFDHFFVSTGECKAKVTAARLPYFDGDYWPGAAEDMIYQLRQEEDGRKQQKKGKTKMTLTKRALKAAGHTDLACNASKDALLMQKLGETISPMKEDFIMVHLQHACTHCCILMVSGNRWVCHICKHFQICDKCYDAEQKLEDRERHPINSRERHDLFPIEITDVAADTKDKDEIVESEFFDTRQAFLSLCQGNHYQYDTLRRAKHSSMMVLYHLHNPTAPAFVTTCNVCHHDVESGQGWRCEVCPDFDVCNACYMREGGIDHPHKMTNHPSNADRDAQSQEARQKRVLQLRKMLELLVHASQCRYPHCQYPNCRRVKGLFRHGIQCKIRASGGCVLCKRMWYLLQLHARACKESECIVPRCKDLKEHLRRLQQQSESRRRAAVMEMMRQRAAELQGGDN
ncbi:histone acetyltransferase HAC1-like isoform X2 [Phalaenopsis equestris]|nr:histone acetyltransferase HAC1-like isoform X2 [Phalaenopsis equestris]XP_020582740.1 histone acetyltransferase HAC1-like isoform X2 [Phalaenopsis equestris]